MATAVLNYLSTWLEENILALLQGSDKPDERIRAMGKNVNQIYDQGEQACLLAMLSIGESHHLFHTQIQQILNAWINALA